ncbi:unnamed protein product [Timema podura]|uniref:Uncharacterized protein n=1 Tax=Timema podura TaxID=61482 RepID=A0ABN7NVL7_TIMPD|nr:unnamed protein product [Timema podura]
MLIGLAYVTPEKIMKAENSESFTNYTLIPVTPPAGVYKSSDIIETPNINASESHGVASAVREFIRERQQLPGRRHYNCDVITLLKQPVTIFEKLPSTGFLAGSCIADIQRANKLSE